MRMRGSALTTPTANRFPLSSKSIISTVAYPALARTSAPSRVRDTIPLSGVIMPIWIFFPSTSLMNFQ